MNLLCLKVVKELSNLQRALEVFALMQLGTVARARVTSLINTPIPAKIANAFGPIEIESFASAGEEVRSQQIRLGEAFSGSVRHLVSMLEAIAARRARSGGWKTLISWRAASTPAKAAHPGDAKGRLCEAYGNVSDLVPPTGWTPLVASTAPLTGRHGHVVL
ncbi:hypothetical protein [Bradyrhizobium sp. HKCCYLS20291]|uniref:hypothetical protein n=1 Tax=Bradyrhizobium sp. HKCCYLS20291 TaxID=3420766 RepID=UPI003EB94541